MTALVDDETAQGGHEATVLDGHGVTGQGAQVGQVVQDGQDGEVGQVGQVTTGQLPEVMLSWLVVLIGSVVDDHGLVSDVSGVLHVGQDGQVPWLEADVSVGKFEAVT